jgi:hypothetical protein
VASVGGDDGVVTSDGGFHAGGDGFLSRGKVTETTDELGFVELFISCDRLDGLLVFCYNY